jgi:FkbM family methyltransferase
MYRPSQIWRRMCYWLNQPFGLVQVTTPWGLPLVVNASESHGRSLLTLGICDLRLSELLYRIIGQGDCAIDVGANVGAMTSLMARRAGALGRVYGIEPHPETRQLLSKSIALWPRSPLACAKVEILPLALSRASGTAFLEEPEGFEVNSGIARISRNAERDVGRGGVVEVRTFDELFAHVGKVRLVKVDVEGHEDDVFGGMRSSLATGSIDFIVFEDFRPLPSAACHALEDFGYSTYLIDRDFWGPKLVPTFQRPKPIDGEPTNVLAVSSNQNLAGLEEAGWQCLRSRGD